MQSVEIVQQPAPSEADGGGVGSGSFRCPAHNKKQRPVARGFCARMSGGEDGAGFLPAPPSAVLKLRKKSLCQEMIHRVEIFACKNTTRFLTQAQCRTVKKERLTYVKRSCGQFASI